MSRKHRWFRHGFTLIELLVTVVLIGILATIAVPRGREALSAARAAALLERYTVVRNALIASDFQRQDQSLFVQNPGRVPRGLTNVLPENFFQGEGDVELQSVWASVRGVKGLRIKFRSENLADRGAIARLARQIREEHLLSMRGDRTELIVTVGG